jgi:metal-dependent HD superfamily phosphatase/phosphodiesterase
MKKSQKQLYLEAELLDLLEGKPKEAAKIIFEDEEIAHIQNYANTVSIRRLGYNDHGPVHMRIAAINAMKMFMLLDNAGIKFNLEKEEVGTKEESQIAVLIGTLIHDLGMSVTRDKHEILSSILSVNIIDRILPKLFDDFEKRIILRSLILECIVGHMATVKINSLEAGLTLVGDGCDMEMGRSRIPSMISQKPKIGDMHRYSASAIKAVHFNKGEEKPIRIDINMTQSVGFYQIEEVLFPKINMSPVKPYIELFVSIRDNEKIRYL